MMPACPVAPWMLSMAACLRNCWLAPSLYHLFWEATKCSSPQKLVAAGNVTVMSFFPYGSETAMTLPLGSRPVGNEAIGAKPTPSLPRSTLPCAGQAIFTSPVAGDGLPSVQSILSRSAVVDPCGAARSTTALPWRNTRVWSITQPSSVLTCLHTLEFKIAAGGFHLYQDS